MCESLHGVHVVVNKCIQTAVYFLHLAHFHVVICEFGCHTVTFVTVFSAHMIEHVAQL